MSSSIPSIQQTSRTFEAFYSASNPTFSTIDTELLKQLLSTEIVVEYRGFDNGRWNKIEGQAGVIAIIQEVFSENNALLKKSTSYNNGTVQMHTLSKIIDGYLETDETYMLQFENGNCVIGRVIANQKKTSYPEG